MNLQATLDEDRTDWTYYHYKDCIESELARSIAFLGEKTKLRDACEYAIVTGGKRLRPILTMMVADALGNGLNVIPMAIGSEYFHSSSLIVDDLPCMDNDDERRGKPTTHKVFGETVSLLASYGLLMGGFKKLHENRDAMAVSKAPFCDNADISMRLALENICQCGGLDGVVGGQFMDMFPGGRSLDLIYDLIYKKTVTLFEGSVVGGWLFGGGDPERLADVKKAAYHLGMAFQMADDIGDLEQDIKNGCRTNIAGVLGKEKSHESFTQEIANARERFGSLGLDSKALTSIFDLIEIMAKENLTA